MNLYMLKKIYDYKDVDCNIIYNIKIIDILYL